MRLLRFDDSGEYHLTEFLNDDEIPPYAILSHTWEDEEVVFQDVDEETHETYNTKKGYKKLQFCADQAANDGLEYFWVDTCCINKSSAVELSEAINSMFDWYHKAARCYVYLSDVPANGQMDSVAPEQHSMEVLKQSRWFTRGWTLQELLAPSDVEFFSTEGQSLGRKSTLAPQLSSVTGINLEILQGMQLGKFSVDDRMSWMMQRSTTIEEDRVYAMLGLINVHMVPLYGEGQERAYTRLRGAIKTSISGYSRRLQLPSSISELPDSDSEEGSDTVSIFSEGGTSIATNTTPSLDTVHKVGIREVARALLSNKDFNTLYTYATLNIERSKTRPRMRIFLKTYGRDLASEASGNILMIQAANFVQELAGRITDEIMWSISGHIPGSPMPTNIPKTQHLESWLASLQEGDAMHSIDEPPGSGDHDIYEHDEIDEDPDDEMPFPHIESVKAFLLSSQAFQEHITAMRDWLVSCQQLEAPVPSMENQHGIDSADNTNVETSCQPQLFVTSENESQQNTVKELESQQDTVNKQEMQHNVPLEHERRTRARRHRSVMPLISGLLNYWGISFFFYDLIELFVPRTAQGYRRLRWRCSCDTVLWGDFPDEDEDAFDQLKREVLGLDQYFTQTTSPQGVTQSSSWDDSSRHAHTSAVLQENRLSRADTCVPESVSTGSGASSSLDPKITVSSTADHVVNITFPLEYFEVCVSIGNHAIDHHEINISRVTSDGELFEMIWEKYNTSRGTGLRRLFLRPSNVDFVLFSVNRRNQFGAGIHKRPDEFPPQEELDKKRYHYLCPKIRMPANVFLHYLHRARWNIWGEHTETTWLRRLPKKLNDRLCDHASYVVQTGQPDPLADPDLAFGWGIHIIDGPNHAVLGMMLAVGVAVAFIVSGLVVGFAKTQEQGFGIGNFLLAIIASIMAAIYFQLQDR